MAVCLAPPCPVETPLLKADGLREALSHPLFQPKRAVNPTKGPGWQLASQPFSLTGEQARQLEALGPALAAWVTAQEGLYHQALAVTSPYHWVAQWLQCGKPADLLASQQALAERGIGASPARVIRPDLLVTERGLTLCELDAVPGGLGFIAALNQAYRQQGWPVIEATDGLAVAFWRWLTAWVPEQTDPVVAVVLNEESADYRLEWETLTHQIRQQTGGCCVAVDASELIWDGHTISIEDEQGQPRPVDLIYRFYELFTREETPEVAWIEAAQASDRLKVTPSLDFHLEEKLWLALWHHPGLADYWQQVLSAEHWALLDAVIPAGWAVTRQDPLARYDGLKAKSQPIEQLDQLATASQKERQLVLKPSGFSPLSWGSRGVTVGHDVPTPLWTERLTQALQQTEQTPWILQRYEKPVSVTIPVLADGEGEPLIFEGRVRLCPYYLVDGAGETQLVSVLATVCPKDKKVIHGMSTAVMAPCQIDALR